MEDNAVLSAATEARLLPAGSRTPAAGASEASPSGSETTAAAKPAARPVRVRKRAIKTPTEPLVVEGEESPLEPDT